MKYCKTLEITSRIKNVSEQKISYEKILSSLEKREGSIYQYDFKLTLEKLVAANTFVLRNGDSYTFHNSYNTILVAETQETYTEEILPPDVNMEDTLKESRAENTSDSNANNDNFVAEIINELNSFREFQAKTESKLDKLEEAIFTDNSKSDIENVNDNTDFVLSLLKRRITSLESELSKKDGIMEFLPDQLVLHSENKSATATTRVFLQTIQLKRIMIKAHYKKRKSLL